MSEFFESVAIVLIFTWPAYVLPLILGPIILTLFRRDDVSRMAGWFTMKPLLATPLWAMMLAWGENANVSQEFKAVMGLIPGIGLTLWIIWNYRHVLRTDTEIVILLLIGDALRCRRVKQFLGVLQCSHKPGATAAQLPSFWRAKRPPAPWRMCRSLSSGGSWKQTSSVFLH